MAAEHWFRWHHGTGTDPKLRTIAKRASVIASRDVTAGHVLSVWALMLECASQANPRGSLVSWQDEDAAAALDWPEEIVAAIREAMEGKTLDGDQLSAWNQRQPKAEDRTAKERKQAQRAREKAAKAAPVTECHGESRAVTTETETETDIEKLPTTSGEGAAPELPLDAPTQPPPADPDPIFGTGLELLTAKGCDPKGARSFLGLLRRDCGDLLAGELLAEARRQDITDPIPWLRKAAQARGGPNGRAPPGKSKTRTGIEDILGDHANAPDQAQRPALEHRHDPAALVR